MITPSFALTATERVLPRMALDFTTATLDPRVTFTRTGNTATVINSSGLVAPINADLPRFDYDPTTLACKGLLIEESSVNLLTYSQDFSNVIWNVKSNCTVVTSATTDPAGATNAYTLSATSTNGIFGRSIVGTIGVPYTYSLWVKRKTGTGAISFTVGDNVAVTITSQVTSSWNRISVTATPTTTTVRAYVVLATNGDAVEIYGAQLEQKSFGTSYIPTVASQVTRTADTAVMTGTNFSSWYNASEGAFVASSVLSRQASAFLTTIFSVTDNTALNAINCFYRTAGSLGLNIITSSVTQFDQTPLGVTAANTLVNIGIAYKLNNTVSYANATVQTTATTVSIPTVTQLQLGFTPTGNYLNGIVKSLRYWPQRILNAEGQAFSK
jgi:hypothetical protein